MSCSLLFIVFIRCCDSGYSRHQSLDQVCPKGVLVSGSCIRGVGLYSALNTEGKHSNVVEFDSAYKTGSLMQDVINAINASDGSFQNTVTEICEYDNNLCAKFGMTMYVVALFVVGTHGQKLPN